MITYDKSGDIIINGWEQGIAIDPYQGISDIRNINLISIPKEASVNFATASNVDANQSGTVTSANAGADTVLLAGGAPSQIQAITFSGGSLPGGIVAGTVYWAFSTGGGNFQLYTTYRANVVLDITSSGTGTWSTVNMGQPKYFNHLSTSFVDTYFMVDNLGQVWSNLNASSGTSPNFNWRYTGNTTTGANGTTHGNGLVSYVPSDTGATGKSYLFVFRDYQIDYAVIDTNVAITWNYGWNPATGTTGNNNYLKSANTMGGATNPSLIHESLVAPDNKVYYCDTNWIGRWYQASPTVGFDPTNTATYVFDQTSVLPFTDAAQCLTPLGNNLLIGGRMNVIYPWDTFSQLPQYPILVAENNVIKMTTVNTNAYALVGNRGRIYIINGSQAQLYKKLPDHLSGTVEPYYTWGGLTSNKNQLYFGALATTNGGSAISQYGGVWAIDVDTKAIRLTNKLSYGTYNGYTTAITPIFGSLNTPNPAGTGLFIGWDSGVSTYGIDKSVSTPYLAGESTIDSDLIPIGTTLKPTTNGRVEFKLSVPVISGESVKLQYRQRFSASFVDIDSNLVFNFANIGSTWNGFSGVYQNVNFENSQWIQIRAVLTSTANSPSYCRMTEIRIGS